MDDHPPMSAARFVAETVFTMLGTTGWERSRTRWVVSEIPGASDSSSGIEAFRTVEDDLGGDDPDSGLVGRRAGPEVVGMAIAGAVVADGERMSEPLRTVLAADRNGRWFRIAEGAGGGRLRTELDWFDGPGSGVRCYLGAPWRGPSPPDPHEVCTRWWIGSLLANRRSGDDLAALTDLARRLSRLGTLELRGEWVPQVPLGWTWDQARVSWAACAEAVGDADLAELVRWADPAELAARVRRSGPVIDPDRLAAVAGRNARTEVAALLQHLGFVHELR